MRHSSSGVPVGRRRADALPVDSSSSQLSTSSPVLRGSLRSGRLLNSSAQRYQHRPAAALAGTAGHRDSVDGDEQDWRIRDRLKTVSCLLCVCLNIGVDPPDSMVLLKPVPCARLECFIDPFRLNPQKSLPLIGKQLQLQYEQIQPRARYKQALDPTADDLKKSLLAMRRSAKDERILFHYNGHGVPRPTASNELWVFNKSYTQYIPVSSHDITQWIGSPAVYVIDASSAAFLIPKQHQDQPSLKTDIPSERWGTDFYLCACRSNETLPLNPDLPADLFTSCLTSPIETSLLYFLLNQKKMLSSEIDYKRYINRIPGRIQDRKTPLGELYWIFTAITDTIAFTTLPLVLFKALFRQDLMVAALFRNFLLAQWILPKYGCNPVSVPAIPASANHDLWTSWEYVLENIILQLPDIITTEPELIDPLSEDASSDKPPSTNPSQVDVPIPDYEQSSFFDDQLSTFETWLNTPPHKQTPTHLPVILQVLLSQHFRYRALLLLCKFLNLGKWAVYHALSVGIFPYVLKLLQSPATELKLPLVFIWSRIIIYCQDSVADLAKENGFQYFVNIMLNDSGELEKSYPDVKNMAAFILTVYARHDTDSLIRSGVHFTLLANLQSEDTSLILWSLLALCEIIPRTHESFYVESSRIISRLLEHGDYQIRAASIFFISQGIKFLPTDQIESFAPCGFLMLNDASPTVRYEVLCLVHHVLMGCGEVELLRETQIYWKFVSESGKDGEKEEENGSTFFALTWKMLLCISGDADLSIAEKAKELIDNICLRFLPEFAPAFISKGLISDKDRKTEKLIIPSVISRICMEQFSDSSSFTVDNQSIGDTGDYAYRTMDLDGKHFQNVFDIGSMATNLLKFHPHDNLLAVVDENDLAAMWDYRRGKRISSIKDLQRSSQFARKTHLEFLNPANENPMLLIGSNDGVVRVFCDILDEPFELTSWRCMPELLPDETGSGMVLNYNQSKHRLIASGDVKTIKLWDLQSESLVSEFNAHASHGISAITTSLDSDVIYSGDTRGKIRVYDARAQGTFSCVKTWKEHKSWIVDLKPIGNNNIHSISSDGSFKSWDVRMDKVIFEYECDETKKTTSAKFHEALPYLIIGSSSQVVKIFDISSGSMRTIHTVRNREGIMGSRLAPVTAVTFHPSRDIYAAGGLEQYVMVENLLKENR